MSNFYHGPEPGRRRRSQLRRPRRTLTHLTTALGSDLLSGSDSPTFVMPDGECAAPHPAMTSLSNLLSQQG